MKISIITVCYNEVETVEKTLESIFFQSYKNIESIVIDGGSTDGTIDIIEKYKDKITYFVSEPDRGIYNAMNKGIKASSGEVLYFLNANDYLYSEDVLEIVADAFKKQDCDYVYGNLRFVYADGKSRIKRLKENLNDMIIQSKPVWHLAGFYKKTLFDRFGLYDENFFIAGDHDFNMKILSNKKTKTFYLDKIMANFYITGISSDKKYKKIVDIEAKLIFYNYILPPFFLKFCYYIKLFFSDPLILFKPKKLFQYINRLDFFK